MADLSKIPLVAMSIDTKTLVSTLLNTSKWVPTDDGVPRDWRGLAHLCDLGGETIPSLASHSDPTGYMITIIQNKLPNCTLKDFESILSKIDRWDVIDDANSLFERDAEKYLKQVKRCETSAGDIEIDSDKQILTIGTKLMCLMDDLYRLRQGLDKQCYDAFLLYSDQDMNFVTEIIDNLEKQHNLKLCIKDRDLIGGITFEHEAVMQLISERCNRMIIVISPNFLKSPANKFFLNYAQAVEIETRQRKIIPCLYKKCQLPPQLCYTVILDYGKVGLYDFWGKLRDSVSVVATENASNRRCATPWSARKTLMQISRPRLIFRVKEKNGELCLTILQSSAHVFHLKVVPTQQSSPNDEKLPAIQNEYKSKMLENSITCEDAMNSRYKPINEVTSSYISSSKPGKYKHTKLLTPWLKKKKETTGNHEKEVGPAAKTISITVSLPSLGNLSSLDIMTPTSSNKPAKRKKNLVGSCVKKMQALLSK